ncbi:MAG: hypothetical protein AAF569_02600 [Pseudomonadota bacterium]
MSWDYVERKVMEALKITRGNPTKARQQLIAWTYEDNKLLYELTKPHMTGIAGHAIGHVVNKENNKDEHKPNLQTVSEQDLNGDFGLEILKAIAGGGSPQFGVENNAPRVGKKQASKSHIDAINQMAGKKSDD